MEVKVVDGKIETTTSIPEEIEDAEKSGLTEEVFLENVEEREGKESREFVKWAISQAEELGIDIFWNNKAGVGLWYLPDGEAKFNLTHFSCRGGKTTVKIRHTTSVCNRYGLDPSIGTDLIDQLAAQLPNAKRGQGIARGEDAGLRLNDDKWPRIKDLVPIKEQWLAAIKETIKRLDGAFAEKQLEE